MTRRDRVLFVCSANVCLSPVAAALFSRHIGTSPIDVWSAGVDVSGSRMPSDALDALLAKGIDLSRHQPFRVSPELLAESDLVICMERAILRSAVVLQPQVWPRAFTLKEFVRRARTIGVRGEREPLDRWISRL